MWHIDNPVKVFKYITGVNKNNDFTVNALMLKEKYDSFPEEDKKELEGIKLKNFEILDVRIKSPNNSAKLLNAKLIRFVK